LAGVPPTLPAAAKRKSLERGGFEGDHGFTVSPAVAQVRRRGFADETVAAFARLITDGDLGKRALQSLRGDKCASPVNSFLSWLIAKARVVYVKGHLNERR